MERISFVIERDHLAETAESHGDSDAGKFKVYNVPVDDAERDALKAEVIAHGKEFRLYDDDDILYYTGKILMPERLQRSEELFIPLDWAEGHAGCTRIDYRNEKTGQWEIL